MSQLHYYDLLIVIGFIILYFILVWGLEKILPNHSDLEGAHDFVDEEYVAHEIALHHYSSEIVDPYLRIESLENECHGYLIEIEQLKNVIYSSKDETSGLYVEIVRLEQAIYLLRQIRHSEPETEGSDQRVEGLDHSHSQAPVFGQCDCA